ncbi:hypothetical protein AAIB42_06690 [Streptococcus ruminicola]|uniref:hypothetical protein n=1 Tax=Streptococcus ruminicola TaxID=2686210 RepID=UPI003F642E14
MKLIASNQMTLVNLTERAETRRETFYKLTNNATVPEAPSEGGRNLLKHNQIGKKGLSTFAYAGQTDSYDCIAPKGSNNWGYGIFYAERFAAIPAGKTLVFSMEVNPDVDCQWNNNVNNTCVGLSSNPYGNDNDDQSKRKNSDRNLKKGTWNQVWFSYTAKDETKDYTLYDATSNFGIVTTNLTADVHFQLRKVKAELAETATPYSQAPEDLGWSTVTLVPTQQQRYLWKFEYVYYSDGSVEVTQPVNLSIAGADGADGTNGQTSHVHFAFADNATGGGFSLTTPKAYMGWYADFNEAASNDPTKYKWGKWKGDQGATGAQGIQGPKGADGKTPYLHIAYANSADGRTGFSTSNTDNKRYLGTYTDYTQADSTDPTKYKWVDMVGTVKVGGRNLAQKTSKDWSKPFTGFSGIQNTCPNLYKVITDGLVVGDTLKTRIVLKYTDIKPVSGKTAEIWIQGAGNVTAWNSGAYPSGGGGRRSLSGSGEAVFELTDKINADHLKNDYWSWAFRTDWIASGSLEWKEAKVEAGTVFSKWSPALEDTQEQIDSKADGALTQEQLNALAEKNRNVEAELAAKASLETIEQWKQAYDAYVAQNDADKTSAEQKLITLTSRVAEWVKDWEDKKVQWSFLDTNMDFGEDGLRLGKKGSPTSILISNDRIGFYSGGSEVASMSNGTLTIDNGIFAKSLQIGHYREEVYEGDKTINVVRWID